MSMGSQQKENSKSNPWQKLPLASSIFGSTMVFKSLQGDFGPELFQLILPILKEKSYEEVKNQIKLLKYF